MKPEIILLKPEILSEEEQNTLYQLLSEEEQTVIQRLRSSERRVLKLQAHARLRREMASRLALDPRELSYHTGEHGKPYFLPDGGWYFSLSYTTDAAVLALAKQPIGVDIEKIRPHRMRFVNNLGTPHELSLLKCAPDDLSLFYSFWTRKEAWLKLTGSGLTVPLTSFDVWDGAVAARCVTLQEDEYCISFCM